MKKLFAITLALALTLSLTGCGGNDLPGDSSSKPANTTSAAGSNSTAAPGKELTASITPVSGWTTTDKLTFSNTDLNAEVLLSSQPIFGASVTSAEYALQSLDGWKSIDEGATFSDVKQITVGDMDAAEYTYTTDGIYRYIYIVNGRTAYSLRLSVVRESNFDAANKDFQSMIDSYTLK